MSGYPLDRLLTAFAGRLHASSVCGIQAGWRLSFPSFDAITLHFVLKGSGSVRIGDGPWQPFAPGSVIIVPPHQGHVLGDAAGRDSSGGENCAPFGDGLVAFTAGQGPYDTLLACGAIARQDGHALGLTDLLGGAPVEALADEAPAASASAGGARCRQVFALMLAEVARPALGFQAMIEALMQQCLILLLRRRLLHGAQPLPAAALQDRRLSAAVIAILESPAAAHSVESLAAVAGMGRTAFAEAFSRAFGQGPIDFVQKARLRAAARLLAVTDLPVKVVAAGVGYASRSHFSRAFAAAYGQDPSGFRRQARPSLDQADEIEAEDGA